MIFKQQSSKIKQRRKYKMSTDTKLYTSSFWGIENIKSILHTRLKVTEFKLKSNHEFAPGYFIINFHYNNEYCKMNIFLSASTPIGPAILLSMAANSKNIEILKTIAETIGGYFEENDCKETGTMINGKLCREDGLQYHLIEAIINGETNGESIPELNDSVKKWQKRVNSYSTETL